MAHESFDGIITIAYQNYEYMRLSEGSYKKLVVESIITTPCDQNLTYILTYFTLDLRLLSVMDH